MRHYWPGAFLSYQIVFWILFFVIGLFVTVSLTFKLKRERQFFPMSFCSFLLKIIRSPFNIALLFVGIISLTRILWISIDPFSMRDIVPRSIERLLYETTYSYLFAIYGMVFWVWYSLFEQLTVNSDKRRRYRLGCIKPMIIFMMIMVIVMQIITSIIKGIPTDIKYRNFIHATYAFLVAALLFLSCGYLFYGYQLYHCVVDKKEEVSAKLKAMDTETNMLRPDRTISSPERLTQTFSPAHPANLTVGVVRTMSSPFRFSFARTADLSRLPRMSTGGIKFIAHDTQMNSPIHRRTQLMSPEAEARVKAISERLQAPKTFADNEDSFYESGLVSVSDSRAESSCKNSIKHELKFEGETVSKAGGVKSLSVSSVENKVPSSAADDEFYSISEIQSKSAIEDRSPYGLEGSSPYEVEDRSPYLQEVENRASYTYDPESQSPGLESGLRLRKSSSLNEKNIKSQKDSLPALNKSLSTKENNQAVQEPSDVSIKIASFQNIEWRSGPIPIEEEAKKQEIDRQEIREGVQRATERVQQLELKVMAVTTLETREADLMKDREFLTNYREITELDQKVIKKIIRLTVLAVNFELFFGILTVITFTTSVLEKPAGCIILTYTSGFLEILSILTIIILFTNIKSNQRSNLIAVSRVGNNKTTINKLFEFRIPERLKQQDESKRKFEYSINHPDTNPTATLETFQSKTTRRKTTKENWKRKASQTP